MMNCAAAACPVPRFRVTLIGLAATETAVGEDGRREENQPGHHPGEEGGGCHEQQQPAERAADEADHSKARKDSDSAPRTSLRPASPVASWPGNMAIVDVMLAARASMPVRMRAGKVTNEPPPASAFCTPAQSPAVNRMGSELITSDGRWCFRVRSRGGVVEAGEIGRRQHQFGAGRDRSELFASEVALAMGAAMVGWAISHAIATAAGSTV